jgi:hypothetical protein
MARYLRSSMLAKVLIVLFDILVSVCIQSRLVLAQRSNNGAPAVHVFATPVSHPPFSGPRVSTVLPFTPVGAIGFRLHPHPVRPVRPVFPIFFFPISVWRPVLGERGGVGI